MRTQFLNFSSWSAFDDFYVTFDGINNLFYPAYHHQLIFKNFPIDVLCREGAVIYLSKVKNIFLAVPILTLSK